MSPDLNDASHKQNTVPLTPGPRWHWWCRALGELQAGTVETVSMAEVSVGGVGTQLGELLAEQRAVKLD